MDLARILVRSVTRAFYDVEYIIIIDALILHSALRDDDLAYLMGQQQKPLRKLCAKLREDGLLTVHSRMETREGAQRPFSKDYYFIDYHRTIDMIKYRLKSMSREVERRYGGAGVNPEDKKEFFCPQCSSEYTMMEVLDEVGPAGFICKRCKHDLLGIDERSQGKKQTSGHEVQSRLNDQLAVFEDLMRQIDNIHVPENTFDTAIANALPVVRDNSVNPLAKSEPMDIGRGNLPAATVRGMRTEPEKISVSLLDDSEASRALESAAEKEKRAKLALQNALPAWHTASTVTGELTGLGVRQEAETAASGPRGLGGDADEETKKAVGLGDDSALNDYFASLKAEQAREAQRAKEEDEDDFSSDSGEFEDVAPKEEPARSPKKVRIEVPAPAPAPAPATNGASKHEESEEEDDFEDVV